MARGGGGEGPLVTDGRGSVPDVASPRLAFWFESAARLRDGPVHLPSNVARTLVKGKQIPLWGDVRTAVPCVWCLPKCQVGFFQKAKMISQPPETLLFMISKGSMEIFFFIK